MGNVPGGTAAAAPKGPAIALNPTTSVARGSRPGTFSMNTKHADGSTTVVKNHEFGAGRQFVTGYKQVENPKTGTTTRVHAEGYRDVRAHDFHSHQMQGGPTYISYKTGLRSATAPGGRPLYRDTFAVVHNERVIQRTVYGNVYYGGPTFYSSPVIRTYYPVTYWGSPYYVYRPVMFEPVVYGVFAAPLVQPVAVVSDCFFCPGRVVAFAAPVTAYSDPVLLMGDLQITTAFAQAVPATQGVDPATQAEFDDVRNELSMAQQQLKDGAETNEELRAQLAGQGAQIGQMKVNQTLADMTPVQVPEDVRLQVRQQVRLAIAQHRNGHASALPDIVSSGYGRIYLFQTAQPLSVVDPEQGDECLLNTGDLMRFQSLPAGDGAPARMQVVTSRPGSCQAGRVVEVPLVELQEMLNAFYARVEDNMKRVQSCGSSPATCLKV